MDDKFKKDLAQLIKEQIEENFIRLFDEGFESIVMPNIERLEDKVDKLDQKVNKLENRMGSLKTRVDQVDRKLDKFSADVINHEARIKKLETAKIAA